jgi:hypothetical protein
MYNVYTNSILTSQKHITYSLQSPKRLTLFTETMTVYCENHMKHTNSVNRTQSSSISNADGKYGNHLALND